MLKSYHQGKDCCTNINKMLNSLICMAGCGSSVPAECPDLLVLLTARDTLGPWRLHCFTFLFTHQQPKQAG